MLGKKVKRNPNNEEQKRLLTKLKRSLTTTVKKSKLAYKDTILQKMKWSSKRAKLFWKLVGKLDHKPNDRNFIAGISGGNWQAHFKNVLLNPKLTAP